MSRILFSYEKLIPTVLLLKEKYCGHDQFSCNFKQISTINSDDIDSHDVLILIRPSDPLSLDIVKLANRAGMFTIFYIDDDLLSLSKTHSLSKDRKKRIIKIANQCKMVLAANPYICKKYAPFTAMNRYALTITSVDYLDKDAIQRKLDESNTAPVKIVYAAGKGHEPLFGKYIEPIIRQLDLKYGNTIQFDFVSVSPEFNQDGLNISINYHQGMPLDQYRVFMSEQRYDIGIAPLEEDTFSRAKHYNKYIEYTSAGIVGVYSNVEPYTNAVIHDENGLLAQNNPDSWLNNLSRLIEDSSLRKKLLSAAYNQISTEFTTQSFISKLLIDIPEFVDYTENRFASKTVVPYRIKYKMYRIYDLLNLILFYTRMGGIKKAVAKVKNHLRENSK